MKIKLTIGIVAAITMALGMNSAVLAKSKLQYPYNDREANLQAMQWFAQQQMAKGMPNPYAGVNPYASASPYNGVNTYFSRMNENPYYYQNTDYSNPYLYNNYGAGSPYDGYSAPTFGLW